MLTGIVLQPSPGILCHLVRASVFLVLIGHSWLDLYCCIDRIMRLAPGPDDSVAMAFLREMSPPLKPTVNPMFSFLA